MSFECVKHNPHLALNYHIATTKAELDVHYDIGRYRTHYALPEVRDVTSRVPSLLHISVLRRVSCQV